jgi:tRNA(fMet)-specific endonuclease VapC
VNRYLLDTNTAGHYINRRFGVRERAIAEVAIGNRIGICVPVLGELWFGVENSASRDRNLQRLIVAVADWTIWPYEIAAAEEYGRIAAELKRSGRPIQQIDIQIAAVARVLGNCSVVSTDGDLAAVVGLKVEDWRASSSQAP